MDSTAVQAVIENTQAVMTLTGTLWVFMGFGCVIAAGMMCIKYTFKGR